MSAQFYSGLDPGDRKITLRNQRNTTLMRYSPTDFNSLSQPAQKREASVVSNAKLLLS